MAADPIFQPLDLGNITIKNRVLRSNISGRWDNEDGSGGQTRIGGELRVPINRFDVRAEAYWVNNGTREAVDGLQLKNTERLGNVQGVGYYAQVSYWLWGDAFVTPDPGNWRPPRLDLSKTPDIDKHGVEVSACVRVNSAFGKPGAVH